MKLSDEMERSCACPPSWVRAAEALEADLADANARAMELTARCDRMRHWHDAFRELADALDLPSHLSATEVIEEAKTRRADLQEQWEAMLYAEHCAQEDAAKGREGVAILTLVYEMREHALRGQLRTAGTRLCGALAKMERMRLGVMASAEMGRLSRLHRRAQSAESRAIKAEREAATLRVRLQGAIAKIPPGDLWRTPEPVVYDGAAMRIGESVMLRPGDSMTIPPVALEASSGGARGLDAAEGCAYCEPHDAPCAICVRYGRCVINEDLAQRRVTERADLVYPESGPPCGWCAEKERSMAAAQSRITDLVSDRREARATIAERDARIEALERERDAHRARFDETECGWCKTKDHYLTARDSRIADLVTDRREARSERDNAIARAERAEATIVRARRAIENRYDKAETAWDACNCVLAILDGREGA